MTVPWFENLKHEELPGDVRNIANVVGAGMAKKIWAHFQGNQLYFPMTGGPSLQKIRNKLIRRRNRQLKKSGEKRIAETLASEFILSPRRIRTIIKY